MPARRGRRAGAGRDGWPAHPGRGAHPALRRHRRAANNQLDSPATADLLHRRGIVWAPDAIVSAGGIIHATAVELRHETTGQAAARVAAIGDTLAAVLRTAERAGITPAQAAHSPSPSS
ncbi:hypothetical protein ACWKSP_06530 [Micromonosporaceae bacterium Da 78-11]